MEENEKKPIGLYVTDEEYELIKKASDLVDRSVSNFVTKCAKDEAKRIIESQVSLQKEAGSSE